MINNVVLVGRMTRDPELRRTGSGSPVTSFTLALDRGFSSSTGQQADFINCVVWNKPAENTAKYCSKGSLVGVEGRLQSRSYQNNQGQTVYVVEVVCNRVQFLDTRRAQEVQSTPVEPNVNDSFAQDMNPVDLEKEFDNTDNTFDIMDDDIQF